MGKTKAERSERKLAERVRRAAGAISHEAEGLDREEHERYLGELRTFLVELAAHADRAKLRGEGD